MDKEIITALVSILFGSGGFLMVWFSRNRETTATLKSLSEMYHQLIQDTKSKLDKVDSLEKELKEIKKKCNNCNINDTDSKQST